MRIYRAKPIAWTDSSVALLNEYGATLGTPAPPAPDNALIPPATKPPLKTLPGSSRTQARKVREWNEKKTTKEDTFMLILVVNAGSSSLKYQVRDTSLPEAEQMLTSGLVENIGTDVPNHEVAFDIMSEKLEPVLAGRELQAIGHRVVQGAEKFTHPTLLTEEVVQQIDDLSPLAPLHNPAHVQGMRAAMHKWPSLPQVAIFDTAFHSTMPEEAWRYAIPYDLADKYSIRRYGFHGTSHKYVAHKAAEYLEEPIERLKLITCHLGNGSSIAAVDQGKVVDTSMGMTPLAGLMMGTRCGDLDPSVVNYLKYTLNITGHELDEILNKKSGLLGISGVSSDKRDVEEAALHGNKRAQLASDMLNYQIKKIVGSYIAAMGGVDAIVFTGGIGEHDEIARAKVCHHMDWLGIRIDTDKNEHPVGDVCDITAWGAKVRTLVIATDEELMIARDTKEVVEK